MRSFIPYLGGKQFLLKRLLPLIPPHDVYCEVFAGGASLLLNKPESHIEVLNDLDGDLVNLWLVARDHPQELVAKLETLPYSREVNEEWTCEIENNQVPTDPIERASRFYYVLRSTFAAYFGHGWAFGPSRPDPTVYQNAIGNIAKVSERLQNVYIDHVDFRRCIKNWDRPTTFFFLDPPYVDVSGYRCAFTEKDHQDLREHLEKIQGKFLLTYNDCRQVRTLYKDFRSQLSRVPLSVQKKIGKRRERMTHRIIMNYEPPSVKQPLKAYKLSEILSLF